MEAYSSALKKKQNFIILSLFFNFAPSIYLDITRKNCNRKTLVKLRIGNHKLEIETGRYDNTSRCERLCSLCDMNEIEDEIHFLFRCSKYSTIRNAFYNKIVIKSLTRCNIQGCGKMYRTLLHFPEPRERTNQEVASQNHEVVNQNLVLDQGTISTFSDGSAVNSSEVLLHVTPVQVISEDGSQITTYGLVDPVSDITMTDPSLVKLLSIKGLPSKLSLTTVSNAEERLKIDFKIASVDNQNDKVVIELGGTSSFYHNIFGIMCFHIVFTFFAFMYFYILFLYVVFIHSVIIICSYLH